MVSILAVCNTWNTSKVTDMSHMFAYSMFNGDISNWNVSNVISMLSMFAYSPFDKDISKWNINWSTQFRITKYFSSMG